MALIMSNNSLAWKVRHVPEASAAALATFSMTSPAPMTSLDSQVPSPSSWAWTRASWCEYSPPALYATRTPSPDGRHKQFGREVESVWTVDCRSFSSPRELENVNFGHHHHQQQQQQQREIGRFLQVTYPPVNHSSTFPICAADNPPAAVSVKGMCATEARSGEPSSGHGAPELDSVLSIVMRQVNEEIRSTCEILGIHPDPCKWSVDDVKAWILWTCRQCALSVSLDLFAMDGASLSQMNVDSFRQRAPQAGETLHAKLDIWRSAYQQTSAATEPAEENFSIGEMLNWLNSSSQDPQSSGQGYTSFSSAAMMSHAGVGQHQHQQQQQQPMASPYSEITASESDVPNDDDIGDDDSLPGDIRSGRSSSGGSSGGSHIHLWQFLKELLSHPQENGTAIRWLDRQRGVFKIEDSVRVAKLWGKRKNRPAMNYDKLSRSIRQYYRKGIMKKTERSQRLVYQFCHPYGL